MTAARRFAATLAIAIAVVAGGCGKGEPAPQAQPRPSQRELPATVAITARGAAEVRLESELPVTVSRFDPDQRELRLLTLGLAQFASLDDGRRVRLAVDLAGMYDGPGRYEFGGASSANPSTAFLHVVALRDPKGPLDTGNVVSAMSFDRLLAPCSVDIAEGERSGRLSCPRIATAEGSEIDLHFEWEAS